MLSWIVVAVPESARLPVTRVLPLVSVRRIICLVVGGVRDLCFLAEIEGNEVQQLPQIDPSIRT